jgi:elongation factor G
VVVHGEAPLAEFQNYQSQLKSMTGGAGTFTMAFSRYEPVPPNIQQDLVARYESPPED